MALNLLVGLPVAIGVWVYLGYPMFAWTLARLAPYRPDHRDPRPTVAVAIAAHEEGDVIAERIADVLAQESSGAEILEILVGSDGSGDRTAAVVAELARADARIRLLDLPRAGQTPTQAALFEASVADVVILTDAETRFRPGCVAAFAEAFRDPSVGCATGYLQWRDERATATSTNEGLYWRYERWVRDVESRAGLLTAVTGAIMAVRRSAYAPVPPTASMDHLLPLYVIECGRRVVTVPGAVATDRVISGLREQFRSRSRTATRGIRANLSMVVRLAPWRHPRAAIAIWSHKLLRWATPWLVLWASLGGIAAALTGTPAALVVPLLVAGGLAAAAAGHLIAGSGRRPPMPLAFARAFTVVNLAFALAWIDVVRGRRIAMWHPGSAESG